MTIAPCESALNQCRVVVLFVFWFFFFSNKNSKSSLGGMYLVRFRQEGEGKMFDSGHNVINHGL